MINSRQQAAGSRQLAGDCPNFRLRENGTVPFACDAFASSRLRVFALKRRAFTLVELLVVIVILGILAGLITAAAIPAVRAARRTTILGEITQLNMALERYKQEHGEYPPDFCGINVQDVNGNYPAREAILRHLRKAFRHYRLTGDAAARWTQFRLNVKQCSSGDATLTDADSNDGMDVNDMTPASALTFWLVGPTAPPGSSTKLIPFSADSANPFAIGGSRLEPFFAFNEDRLVRRENDDPDWPDRYAYYYKPPHVKDPAGGPDTPPYVYFRARNDKYETVQQFDWPLDTPTTHCVPYIKTTITTATTTTDVWFNPDTAQIICCGLDGLYSPENGAAGGRIGNLTPEEDDNLTNFSKGELGDWNEEK
ncbi:MAG TPA: prepilin-type N-terminal cleavage/methylation domain-containing protein [Thermoguttaceae bacterium]|nr:prepilin-type N-terminal cleavage/methylation domain-containing protein [Thermoguttaceae bacterium]